MNAKQHELDLDAQFAQAQRAWKNARDALDLSEKFTDGERIDKILKEALATDPSKLTPFLILRGYVREALGDTTLPMWDLVTQRARVDKDVEPLRTLWNALNPPVVERLVVELRAQLLERAEKLGLPKSGERRKEFVEAVQDDYVVACLARDAVMTSRKLHVQQFTRGDGQPRDLKWNRELLFFENVNSLVDALFTKRVDGVTVCATRQRHHTFFAFAVQNGGGTWLFSESNGEWPTDNDRMHEHRRHQLKWPGHAWFPYEAIRSIRTKLEAKDDDEAPTPDESRLVYVNTTPTHVAKVGECDAYAVLWLALMMPLVQAKFGDTQPVAEEGLTYTTEMTGVPDALPPPARALAVQGAYQPLRVERLTIEDVSDKATAGLWESKPTGFWYWMRDRYLPKVPAEVLDVILNLTRRDQVEAVRKPLERIVPEKTVDKWNATKQRWKFSPIDPMLLGNAKKVREHRLYNARFNLSCIVQAMADLEFEAKQAETQKWLDERLEKQLDEILDRVAQGEWVLPTRVPTKSDSWERDPTRVAPRSTMKVAVAWKDARDILGAWDAQAARRTRLRLGEWAKYSERVYTWICPVTNKPATLAAVADINCPEAIAAVLGVSVAKLPFGLQRWYDTEPYTGNSGLSRLDPLDWNLENPWKDGFPLNPLVVGVSEKVIVERRTKMGLPAHTWERKGTPPEERKKRGRRT